MPEPVITTARTARHGFPHLFPGQAQKEAFVNEALARLDALLHLTVIDERAEPPSSPLPGDCHIIAPGPTGAWSGHAGAIASWAHGQWLFSAPSEGMRAFDVASGCVAVHTAAGGWRRVPAPAPPAGGTAPDAEARAALAGVIEGLRDLGIFS